MTGDIHALSGAYAVDAVDDFERIAFERHLAQCETCAAEVASLREAADELAQISLAGPPPSLRDSILAEIDTVRPAPPVVVSLSSRRQAERPRRRVGSLIAAAAALVLVGGVGATVWQQSDDRGDQVAGETARVSAADRVLDASDARTFTETTPEGVTLSVTHSAAQDRSVLTAAGLAPLSEEQVYELWLEQDGSLVSAGFLKDPTSSTVLQGEFSTATLAGVTVEPAGGSTKPSMNNLIGTVPLAKA